jgi:hypothetical protein
MNMKKVKELVTRTKDIRQSLLLNDEKITIINQGKIVNISKYFVEIEGQILGLAFGFNHENI